MLLCECCTCGAIYIWWCVHVVLCFQSFAICLHLIWSLFMSSIWPYHFVCGVVLLLVFMVPLLFVSCSLLLCLRILGIGWEKRKVSGAWEMNEIQQVMWDLNEVGASIRETKGKIMTVNRVHWVHCNKWMMKEKSWKK